MIPFHAVQRAHDGQPIGKVNFVLRDSKDRIWLTVSTRIRNWMEAIRPGLDDGFIALADERGLRIVADGLHFTNEVRLDAKEEYLYAVETCGRRITRFRVGNDGSLSQREVFGPSDFGPAGFPDGCAFDSYGNLWVTLPFANKLVALTPALELVAIVHDPQGLQIEMPTNLCWGGTDRRDLYVVSRRANKIVKAHTSVAGAPLANWPLDQG